MRNILKATVVIAALMTGFSANAQGSMAPGVKVIVVNPSRTMTQLSEQRKAYREKQYLKDFERRMEQLDKIYKRKEAKKRR